MSTDTTRSSFLRDDRKTVTQLLSAAERDTDAVSVFMAGCTAADTEVAIFVVKGPEQIAYLRSLCERQGLLTDKAVTAPSNVQPKPNGEAEAAPQAEQQAQAAIPAPEKIDALMPAPMTDYPSPGEAVYSVASVRNAIGAALALQALAPQAEQQAERDDLDNLLSRFERHAQRFGELWERCQGKGWPTKESDEFTALRDDKLPALKKRIRAALAAQQSEREPIDMVLHCPKCGMQHIDASEPPLEFEPGAAQWNNPPHRSHLCHGCSHIWRPADVPTNGVQAVKTKGKADSPVMQQAEREPLSQAAQDVLEERQRQIEREGYTRQLDADMHDSNDLARAAAFYAMAEVGHEYGRVAWPWDEEGCKVKDRYRNFIRAAAMLIAAADVERARSTASHVPVQGSV